MDYAPLLRRLVAHDNLTYDETASMIGEIMDGSFSAVQSAALLAALASKGEISDEVAGAAAAMGQRSLHVDHDLPLLLDIVGTGGDNANTINISTMAALTVAAAGIPVAKHGNRAASSACGSADVLEAQGMKIDVAPERAQSMLRECGFTFLFAPRYHPAMKTIAPVRRELGIRTIFNILGPLTNPARATHVMVGVARPEHLTLVGDVLRVLGVQAGAVVHAASGIDEVDGESPTAVYSFDQSSAQHWTIDPEDYGVRAPRESIRGGSVEASRRAFEEILAGERSARSDVVALNAGLALWLCSRAPTIQHGIETARAVLYDGRTKSLFERAKRLSHD
jgi:anthranilate phosphoribosyltransferase